MDGTIHRREIRRADVMVMVWWSLKIWQLGGKSLFLWKMESPTMSSRNYLSPWSLCYERSHAWWKKCTEIGSPSCFVWDDVHGRNLEKSWKFHIFGFLTSPCDSVRKAVDPIPGVWIHQPRGCLDAENCSSIYRGYGTVTGWSWWKIFPFLKNFPTIGKIPHIL